MTDETLRPGPEPGGDTSRVQLRPQGGARAGVASPPPQGGHYALEGEIARGGMGRILRARDVELGREVALKVLDAALLGDPVAVRRFVEEAQIGGQLQHPGVVPVYEMGRLGDASPFFAMKLVKGSTFAELLARRAAPEEEQEACLRVFESACQTVGYAHSKGVIHRDLKPANIMVGAFGEVLVVDWGLAKVLAGSGEPAAPEATPGTTVIETVRSGAGSSAGDSLIGSVMGTPAYMPPEQATGRMASLDERADVFALGAILCQILTGRPPYVGTDEERTIVQAAQAHQEPALERLERSSAPAALKELCRECLCPARQGRPRHAGEVAARVRAYTSGLVEEARRAQLVAAEARVRAAGERRARRLTLGLSAAVVVAVVAVAGAHLRGEAAREERAATLARAIDGTRSQVLALHGEERYEEALQAAQSGLRVVRDSPEADASVRARADELEALALARASAARERAERAVRNARLVAELEELRLRQIDTRFQITSRELDGRFTQAFRAFGLELGSEGGDFVAAVDALRASGIAGAIVAAIDDWAAVRRKLHGPRSFEAGLLTSLASDLDPDGPAAAARGAILAGDEDELLALARSADVPALGPEALWTLAFAVYDFGHRDASLRLVERGVRVFPGDFILELATAIASRDDGRQDLSLPHFQAACALRPQAGYARLLLGSALYELGELPQAIAALREAVRLDDDDARVRYELANALAAFGDQVGALEAFDGALALRPDDPTMKLDREGARFTSGRASRAEFLHLLDGGGPWSPSELVAFGFALSDHPDPTQRDPERALAIGREIRAAAPEATEGILIVARAALGAGQPELVLATVDTARERLTTRSRLLRLELDLLRVRALHALGRADEARALLAQAERAREELFGIAAAEWERSSVARRFAEARAALGRSR